jgi:hypothetical protein
MQKRKDKNKRKLLRSDIKLIKALCSLTDLELLDTLRDLLIKYGYVDVVCTDDYLIAEGDIPIGLVAHCDTVFTLPPEEWFYDSKRNVLWSPDGAGFDDRAGVFAIIKILTLGYRPSIIFTNGEEIGGVGSFALVDTYKEIPFRVKPKFLIQFDRMGNNDCVFYDCLNREFIKDIKKYGFQFKSGTFSDISILGPFWEICAVNLSIGYYDEHTTVERLFIDETYHTIEKAINIIEDIDKFPYYKYLKSKTARMKVSQLLKFDDDHCYWCNKKVESDELFYLPKAGTVKLCKECSQFLIP